jgi:PIN domain nuclease of toxin-antitoxin system
MGLEVPCMCKMTGKEKLIVKARKILESRNIIVFTSAASQYQIQYHYQRDL